MNILKSVGDLSDQHIRDLYYGFDSPIATLDCGRKCAPHNPSGKPFCCDVCHAVPAAYKSEWNYLEPNTMLWHVWRGDECESATKRDRARVKAEMPKDMILLACLGPSHCQRDFRALSCRQFPFFPYVTSNYRFIGLAYEWEFESKCWVISNLSRVTRKYREEFVRTYDHLFALFQGEFDSYAHHSERMRNHFSAHKRRIPILHRNGKFYLVSPVNERVELISPEKLQKFGPYR
ncbi:MAG: hypothetical protein C3F07_00590 [Anaerolineales bacterium]|nr:hypothetical protein [Anaerolineae bacterium]PWB77844.1 MAG: hypothetical protein C3F07_00590 [Anaerolineales bacterium]